MTLKKRDIEWAIYYEKNKEKRNENKNKNKKLQDNENGEKQKQKQKKEREIWTLLNTAYSKKNERTDIFSKIDSTSLHRLKKRREENWTFLNCDCNIVLTCCKVKLFEFEFKGDIRKFFFPFILWNLTKTINRGFSSRFTNICNYIDSKKIFFFFFRI